MPTVSLIVGSADNADIVLDDPSIASQHAEVSIYSDGECLVRDLGTQHGTYHNEMRMYRPVTVYNPAVIRFGNVAQEFGIAEFLAVAVKKYGEPLFPVPTRPAQRRHYWSTKTFLEDSANREPTIYDLAEELHSTLCKNDPHECAWQDELYLLYLNRAYRLVDTTGLHIADIIKVVQNL